MPADKGGSSARRVLQPACDACHMRRVKCSHEQPCAHCSRLGLTCTYAKAQTAKKTAGKRIEALRQADRTRQLYADRRNEMWGATPSQAGPSDRTMWNNPSSNGDGYEPGHGSNAVPTMPADPRYHGAPSFGERGPQHTFQHGPASNAGSHQANHPTPQSTMSNSASSTSPWGHSSPHARSFNAYEGERQVHFQAPSAPVPQRAQYGQAHGTNGVGSKPAKYGAPGHNQPSHPPRENGSFEPSLMPSPSQFFANHADGRPFGIPVQQHQSQQQQHQQPTIGSMGGNGVVNGLDTASITTGMGFDASIPAADYLESSLLPPFSTSLADSLFSNQNVFNTDNIFDESSMPPLVSAGQGQQTMLDLLGTGFPSGETPGSIDSASMAGTIDQAQSYVRGEDGHLRKERVQPEEDDMAQHPLSDSALIPTLAIFYERLGGVLPVFSRSWIFSRLDRDDHQTDPHFAALLIAMSALVVLQAQPIGEGKDKRGERMSSRRRRAKATRLLEEALKLREGPTLGQTANLEMCCTSFFIFATLFALGEHSAAWYRLRESITLAHLCRLHEPSAYEGLPRDEAERRLRAYWLLAITERAFAIQSGMPLMLTGNPRASTASLRAKLGFKELSDFPDLQLRLFDHVDEKFVDCWNRKCQGPGCPNFNVERAIALWRSFTDGINQPGSRERSTTGDELDDEEGSGEAGTRGRGSMLPSTPIHRRQVQRADVEVTRHWLLNRLWLITLNHGLLSIDAQDPPLRVDHAIHVAQSVYDVCDSLSLAAMEAHGVGFTYKLFDIAQTLVLLCKDGTIAEAISKGGVGEQLEKQTTKVHTGGRGRETDRVHGHGNSRNRSESSVHLTPTMFGDVLELSLTNTVRGPASLRRIVMGILNEYHGLFQRFRGGDHVYLGRLIELINDLKVDMDADHAHGSNGIVHGSMHVGLDGSVASAMDR